MQKIEPTPPPKPNLVLPPLPALPDKRSDQIPTERVFIKKIQILGSTVITAAELSALTAPYENRLLSYDDLESLRVALSARYASQGFINSGAIIPDQDIRDGIVTLQIVEGELSHVELEGNRWFRDFYLRDRIALNLGRPFNINALQENMQLLLQDRRLERLNAELGPGLKLGESVLRVKVEEGRPYKLRFEFNNFQSPSVGSKRGLVTAEHLNVFGIGDAFSAQYGGSSGIHPQLEVRYSVPVNRYDTAVSFNYRKNNSLVVEREFADLEIENKSEIFGLSIRHPIYRSLQHEVALELIAERLSNKTFLLGEPFSFAVGAENGKSVVSALRFAQEWVRRSESDVIAARSRFSFGVDMLGATIHSPPVTDSHFFSWLGQFQWAKRWSWLGIETLYRNDIQVANDSLFSLEQIAVGGRYSVRGYRENTLVRDNAAITSLEIRVPLITGQPWAEYLQVAPFYDIGYSWNRRLPTTEPRTLHSVGLGLRWGMALQTPMPIRPQFEIYWGKALTKVKTVGGDLQDHGLHLQFSVALF